MKLNILNHKYYYEGCGDLKVDYKKEYKDAYEITKRIYPSLKI